MSKIPYPCVGGPGGACPGLCCYQAADALKSMIDLRASGHKIDPKILDFPYTVDQVSGRCENLMDDGGCKVYLDRPLLCNITEAAKALNFDPMIFLPANAEACNNHMDNAGIPREQQIDIEKYRIDLLNNWKDAKLPDNQRGADRDRVEPNPHAQYPLTPDECYSTGGDDGVPAPAKIAAGAGEEVPPVQD